jgi:hypothetical protein
VILILGSDLLGLRTSHYEKVISISLWSTLQMTREDFDPPLKFNFEYVAINTIPNSGTPGRGTAVPLGVLNR